MKVLVFLCVPGKKRFHAKGKKGLTAIHILFFYVRQGEHKKIDGFPIAIFKRNAYKWCFPALP